ncbi:hypothetical protein HMPREF1981_00335 [Bacteroides pyogenes F0041]|uniref:Lipoprotein n=1 Tax=Bacteroides pyogenes F0041 TaxID=1321819 RepID=U2CXH8_9BACE|nr:hypothetical protein [Bacteroides pyogenes]ERI88773.1 hypothetical protein HMPREF1981_00335 [Bacteroides pyogenes F0041]
MKRIKQKKNQIVLKFFVLSITAVFTSCVVSGGKGGNELIISYDDNINEINSPQSNFVDKIEIIPLKSNKKT